MAVSGVHKASVYSGSNLTSYSTGSWTPSANRLAIVAVQSELSGSPAAPTLSGNSLTWSQLASYQDDTSGTQSRITIFVAKTGSSPSAGAVTADFGAVAQAGCNIIVDEFNGVDVSGTALQAIVQNKNGSIDASGTSETITLNSAITSGNASYGAFHHQADEGTSFGTGYAELGDGSHAGPSSALQSEYKATGSTTVDASWTTSSGKGAIALEIKASVTPISGTLNKSQSSDTLTSANTLQIKSTLSKTQSDQALSSQSDLIVKGSLSKTQAGDILSANGKIIINAIVNQSQSNNILSSQSGLEIKASSSINQADDGLIATSEIDIQASIDTSQDNQLLSATAQISNSGALVVSQHDQTLYGRGSGLDVPPIAGSLIVNQADNALDALGSSLSHGAMNTTQDDNTSLSNSLVTIRGSLASSQDDQTIQSLGVALSHGVVNAIQQNNLAISIANLTITGNIFVNQSDNTANAIGDVIKDIEGPGQIDVIHYDQSIIRSEEINIIYSDVIDL